MNLIQTSHGTVCARCLLWPDLCSCDGANPAVEALANLFGKTTESLGRCPICGSRNCQSPNCGSRG